MIYRNITNLIGNTPMMELANYGNKHNLKAKIIAKLEFMNPLGSIKDRVAFAMIMNAQVKGIVDKHSVIIEPTSGNTGIGLAYVCASHELKLILTMPETMSKERVDVLRALGAEVILTEGKKGMQGAVDKAMELAEKYPNSFIPSQFENPDNPNCHKRTTAKEIISDMEDENVDAFVSAYGTGGTVSGTGAALKEHYKNIKIVGVEPTESPLVSKGVAGPHKIQGIGANFVPKNLDVKILDEIITVKFEDAKAMCQEIAKVEGMLVGVSAGAALVAATELAKRDEFEGKNIVVILPDTGERYLSTGLFE